MTQPQTRYCSTCGAVIPTDAAICGECGARYRPSPYERHATDAPRAWSPPPQQRNRNPQASSDEEPERTGIEFISRESLRPRDPAGTQLREAGQYDRTMADQQNPYPPGPSSGPSMPSGPVPPTSGTFAPAAPTRYPSAPEPAGGPGSSAPSGRGTGEVPEAVQRAVSAPFGRRLVAELIDGVISSLTAVPLLIGLLIVLVQGSATVLATVLIGIGAVLPTAYSLFIIWLEGAKGVTVGKKVMGLRTVRYATGKRIGFLRSLGRFVLYGIFPLLFALSIFLDGRGTMRGWHDKAIDSYVVDLKNGEDPMNPRDHFERPDDSEFLGRAPVAVSADENLLAQPGSPWSASSASSASAAPERSATSWGSAPSANTGWGVPASQSSAGGASASSAAEEPPLDRSPWAPVTPQPSTPPADPQQSWDAPAADQQQSWDAPSVPAAPAQDQAGQAQAWDSRPDAAEQGSADPQQAWDSDPQQRWDSDPQSQGAGYGAAQPTGGDASAQPSVWDSAPQQPEASQQPAPAPEPSVWDSAPQQPAAEPVDPETQNWSDEVDESTRVSAAADMEDLEQTRLSAIAPAAPPSVRLRLDDGTERVAQGTVVVGRNPTAEDGEVQFVLKDDTRSISKTHLRVRVDADGIQVTDLGSTNGSAVVRADGARELLVPHTATVLPEGASVAIGDRTLSVEKMP